MEWFRAWNDGILRGSLSRTNEIIQLIWLKLIAIENETRARDGWLHFAPGQPMTHEYLAQVCGVSVDWIEEALRVFLGDIDNNGRPRIKIEGTFEDGDIFLMNWEHYQSPSANLRAKEVVIEKAKRTSKTKDAVAIGMVRVVNRLDITSRKLDKQVDQRLVNKSGDIKEKGVE